MLSPKFSSSEPFHPKFNPGQTIRPQMHEVVNQGITAMYTGSHEFTPSSSMQTIPIANKASLEDIVINPIPSNYGLITYDGSVITVS